MPAKPKKITNKGTSSPKKAVTQKAKAVAKKAVAKKPVAKKAVLKKAAGTAATSALKEGDRAPDFRLQDDAGRVLGLKDFAGKSLVLYFYPKDDTPGCTQESCDFRDNLNRLVAEGAAVAGVSADPVESHRKFKAKHGLNFPLLSDPDRSVLKAYGVWREKSLYGRKFMGIVRSTFVIDGGGRVRRVFSPVKVAGHVNEVLAALPR